MPDCFEIERVELGNKKEDLHGKFDGNRLKEVGIAVGKGMPIT